MEENNLQPIDIRRILALAPAMEEQKLGTDLFLGEVSGTELEKSEAILSMLRYPIRFDGYIVFFLKKGHFTLDINLNTFQLQENSLLITAPGNILKLSKGEMAGAEMSFVLMSREFLNGIHFDFNKVIRDSIRIWNSPCITLCGEHLSLAEGYFNLAQRILSSAHTNKMESLRGLFTSFIYVIIDVWTQQLAVAPKEESRSSARVNQIFERFIALVTEYHTSQRGMAFYADKLCLTPKYLSKLIKQASGRSAPEWIDDYVILEAKNLLKYSDMAIKEIVYTLHFPNQSVFYKFFKAHTGQTPSEYRRG